ncbi:MAG: MFS transporter [Clostridia bacterium]|jgi:DHA3 family macrolide efflux protein-like MFS transporter|nr:MFS transporter [Clostridiales bacterium]
MNSNPIDNNNSWKKEAALFLISQNVSLFGSSVVAFSIIWHITLQTSSGTWMMLFTVFSLLPQVLISLWAGVWADRYNRKFLIMLADGFIALATLGLAVAFWAGYQRLELLLVVSLVRSIGAGIQMPAVNALYPQIVPQEKLTKVQGINQTLSSVLMLLSPAVGGVVLGSVGIFWAFMLDVITASLAIITLGFIRIEKVVRHGKAASVFNDLRDGVFYVMNNRLLRQVLICFGVSFFLFTPASVLTPLLVERSLGGGVWHLTANEIVWTVGSLVGGAFVSIKGEFRDKVRTVALCLVAFGVTFALLGVAGNFYVYLIIMGIAGFFMPIISTAQTVLLQENVEAAMMGRVFSLVQIVTGSAMPVAILLFGPLADIVPIGLILLVSGVLLAVTGITYGFAGKRIGVD